MILTDYNSKQVITKNVQNKTDFIIWLRRSLKVQDFHEQSKEEEEKDRKLKKNLWKIWLFNSK